MDKFIGCFGDEVDLDDLSIYEHNKEFTNDKYGGTTFELWDECIHQIGYAFMYMNYFHPDTERMQWGEQRVRVYEFCKIFADGERAHRFDDTPDNRLWFKKFLYKFTDEIENMC